MMGQYQPIISSCFRHFRSHYTLTHYKMGMNIENSYPSCSILMALYFLDNNYKKMWSSMRALPWDTGVIRWPTLPIKINMAAQGNRSWHNWLIHKLPSGESVNQYMITRPRVTYGLPSYPSGWMGDLYTTIWANGWLIHYPATHLDGWVTYTLPSFPSGWMSDLYTTIWMNGWPIHYHLDEWVTYILPSGWMGDLYTTIWMNGWPIHYHLGEWVTYTLPSGWMGDLQLISLISELGRIR